MENINLTKLTQLELWDLQNNIRIEQENRNNAAKLKIYVLNMPYGDGKSYLDPIKAMEELQKQLLTDTDDIVLNFIEGDDDVFITLKIKYVDQAHAKFCEDYDTVYKFEG